MPSSARRFCAARTTEDGRPIWIFSFSLQHLPRSSRAHMTANPLMLRQPARAGRVTVESLEAYADELNRMRFVKASRQPYFVNRRLVEETHEYKHFLDRKVGQE